MSSLNSSTEILPFFKDRYRKVLQTCPKCNRTGCGTNHDPFYGWEVTKTCLHNQLKDRDKLIQEQQLTIDSMKKLLDIKNNYIQFLDSCLKYIIKKLDRYRII